MTFEFETPSGIIFRLEGMYYPAIAGTLESAPEDSEFDITSAEWRCPMMGDDDWKECSTRLATVLLTPHWDEVMGEADAAQ